MTACSVCFRQMQLIMPPPAIAGEEHHVFGLSVRPSVHPSVNTYSAWRDMSWDDFSKTWHNSSLVWTLLKRFSNSEVDEC